MLVRLRTGNQRHDEVHVNPSHIAVAKKELVGSGIYRYSIETIGGMMWDVDESGYERIVLWMEEHEQKK